MVGCDLIDWLIDWFLYKWATPSSEEDTLCLYLEVPKWLLNGPCDEIILPTHISIFWPATSMFIQLKLHGSIMGMAVVVIKRNEGMGIATSSGRYSDTFSAIMMQCYTVRCFWETIVIICMNLGDFLWEKSCWCFAWWIKLPMRKRLNLV